MRVLNPLSMEPQPSGVAVEGQVRRAAPLKELEETVAVGQEVSLPAPHRGLEPQTLAVAAVETVTARELTEDREWLL